MVMGIAAALDDGKLFFRKQGQNILQRFGLRNGIYCLIGAQMHILDPEINPDKIGAHQQGMNAVPNIGQLKRRKLPGLFRGQLGDNREAAII